MQRRHQRDAMGVMLLLNHVLFQVGLEAIPPVTLFIVLAQACTFLQLFEVPWRDISGACISVNAVIFKKQWLRIFYGAIEHGDSLHLYYNMVSFIWKGMLLEPVLGGAQFAYIIVLFTALCGIVLLGLNYLLGTFVDSAFYYQCAVGFSGVIFALKVLNNYYFPGRSRRFLGIDIDLPAGQVVWLELVLIQLVTPNASLVGHLAGILVGLAYVYGVITPVSDLVWNLLGQQPTRLTRAHYGPLGRRREPGGLLGAMPFGAILVSVVLVALQADIMPRHWKRMVDAPCLASSLVIDHHQWKLLFIPALHTSGSLHLAYTVLSLLGLGYYLEHRMGIFRFLGTLLTLTVLTNIAFCLVTYYILPNHMEVAGVRAFQIRYKCFLGLTATLIAMKGIYTAYYPTGPYLFLFLPVPVPKLLGVIFEFALLHFALPHVWIVGNAIGFFAAFMFVILS
uniref:Peptidase S54 rhomboid domain-containing protein n=1 Tax=Rhipicephalus pulchellus TaxID=72859 RepID=L7M4E6_RHIPC